jgi:hypothetical protein
MLVWDDRSSTNVPVLKGLLTGVMGTFDEELRTWVSQNAPGVQLALVAREGDDKQSVFEGLTASACFSHHQVRLPSAPLRRTSLTKFAAAPASWRIISVCTQHLARDPCGEVYIAAEYGRESR